MKYENIIQGQFESRPNRFIANVWVEDSLKVCHVKNTGRCKELLTENATVFLEDFSNRQTKRKLNYSLICVQKGERLINIDSQAPNKVVYEGLVNGKIKLDGISEIEIIKPEFTYSQSRFDFFVRGKNGEKAFIEVKGVTLEEDNVVLFPDAPTERGVKHIKELIDAKNNGYLAFVIFVIQMEKIKYFTPNYKCHNEFGEILKTAFDNGIKILAYDCKVECDSLEINNLVEVKF